MSRQRNKSSNGDKNEGTKKVNGVGSESEESSGLSGVAGREAAELSRTAVK